MSTFGEILKDAIKDIKPPIIRVFIILSIFIITYQQAELYKLGIKVDEKIDKHDIEVRQDMVTKDSTIAILRRDKNYLINRIDIIQSSYNEERIKMLKETIEKLDKIKRRIK